MVKDTESPLGFALLGLLRQRPASGYDLRLVFASTPMGHFSDSPGAVYPALRRLAGRGWIAPLRGRMGGRRRQPFALTPAGRGALSEWLRRPATRDEVVREWEVLMLRLAFMTGNVEPAATTRFLDGLAEQLRGYLDELEAFLAAEGPRMPLSGRLAFESGVEGYRARARWLGRARSRARQRRRKP